MFIGRPDDAMPLMARGDVPRHSPFSSGQTSADPDFGETLSAGMRRNNLMGAGINHALTSRTFAPVSDEVVNPVAWLRDNLPEEDFERLGPDISKGNFVDLFDPNAIAAHARRLLQADKDDELLSQSDYAFGASMVAGVIDPFAYVPYLGWSSKVRAMGPTARVFVEQATANTIVEATLYAMDTQNEAEAFGVMAASTILGTSIARLGVGVKAAKAKRRATINTRSSINHPDHPNNPLRPENLEKTHDLQVRQGPHEETISSVERDALRADADSMGAARTKDTDLDFTLAGRKELGENATPFQRGLRAAGDFFHSKTIVGRMVRLRSDIGRRVAMRISDPGGMLFEHHLAGRAGPKFAEEVKEVYMLGVEQLNDRITSARADLDTTIANTGKTVDEKDFYKITQRILSGVDDAEVTDALKAKYGNEVFTALEESAFGIAEDIHKLNDFWESKLVEHGMVQDTKRIAKLEAELAAYRNELEVAKVPYEDGVNEGAARNLDEIRGDRDRIRDALAREKAKPKPLGREYGHAQLWKPDMIVRAPEEFRNFLLDVLQTTPEARWLAEIETERFPGGLTPDEFAALKTSDPEAYREILNEWTGDEWVYKVEVAQAQLKGAEQSAKESMLDLREMISGLTKDRHAVTDMTISKARKVRDRIAAQIAEREQSLATRKTTRRLDNSPESKREAAQLKRDTKRLEVSRERLRRADEAFAKADAKLENAKMVRNATKSLLKELRAVHGVNAKSLKSAQRQLKQAVGSSPLADTVDDIVTNLTKQGRIPATLMDRIPQGSNKLTGRVKERFLHLNPEQRGKALKAGWLDDNLPKILYRQNDQLAGEISLRETLDIGEGRYFDNWSSVVDSVRTDYDRLVAEAAQRGDKDLADSLSREWQIAKDDLQELHDRLKGQVMNTDGTSEGWFRWLSSKARAWNLSRFVGGFVLGSLTDSATGTMVNGNMIRQLQRSGQAAMNVMKRAYAEDPTGFQSFISAVEVSQGALAAARRFGGEDLIHGDMAGHGIGWGRTREVTGRIDKATEWISQKSVELSGMPLWNRFMKTVAMLEFTRNLDGFLRRYDALTEFEMADLASLGIGREEAPKLREMFERHAKVGDDGVLDPHLEDWSDLESVRTYKMAVMRNMNRAVNTPGIGDTPRLMSEWYGRMWLQFQTFSFTFLNRTAFPAYQRMQMGDPKVYEATAMLFAAATAVVMGKDIIRGKDPSERLRPENIRQTMYDVFDRTGLMGWTSPYADATMKLSGLTGSSRYVRNEWAESALGVGPALFDDVQTAGLALVEGDEKLARKLLILGPLSTQTRLIYGALME